MKKLLLTLNILLVMMSAGFSQVNYDWDTIVKALQTRSARTAEKLSLQALHKAQKNNDCPAEIRSIVFLVNAYDMYREQPVIDAIKFVEKQKASTPECQTFKNALLGYLYYAYYSRNRWKIIDRTNTQTTVSEDIRTWTVIDFARRCNKYFSLALQNIHSLRKYDAHSYDLLFSGGNMPGQLIPTAFDLTIQWILEFYTDMDFTLTHPQDFFSIKDPAYFLLPDKFTSLSITTTDTLSQKYRAMQVFQVLEKAHLDDADKEALVNAYLERLQYVYKNYTGQDKDRLYLLALEKLINTYPGVQRTSYAYYLKSKYFFDNADPEDTLKKDYLVKALDLAQTLIKKYKQNEITREAITKAQVIIKKIKAQDVKIKLEEPLPPGEKSPMLITYKNLDRAYLRIYHLTKEQYNDYMSREEVEKILSSNNYLYNSEFKLTDPYDYYQHTTEIILPGLMAGKYLIVLGSDKDFKPSKSYIAYSKVNVTSFSFITQEILNKLRILVTNRLSGLPQKHFNLNVNDHTVKTNDIGLAITSIPRRERFSNEVTIIAGKGNDELKVKLYAYPNTPVHFPTSEKAAIFLDRKIYRPGQIVYFKGLVYETNNRDYYSILANRQIDIKIYDLNRQLVKEINTTTDRFGGFSGQFIIPQGHATGRWQLEVSGYTSTSFMVEEYKRPQFYVEFNKLDKAYIAGDVITVTGKAQNYNGIPLDKALVKYSIKKRIGSFWYWWWTRSEEYVVGTGETHTRKDGSFSITFPTDSKIEQGKIIEYVITAKVTDINGETHSATTSTRVGSQSVFINIQSKQWLETNTKHHIKILIKNIQEQEQKQLIASYQVVELTPPARHPFINRLWPKPDLPVIPSDEWHKQLPLYEYDAEADIHSWTAGKTLLSGNINSGSEIPVTLPHPGIFKVKVTTTDPKTGKQISKEKFIYSFDTKSKKPIDPLPFYAHVLDSTYQPGDQARIIIGSAFDHAHLYYQVAVNDQIIQENYLTLDNGQKLLTIPVTKDMQGNFAVNLVLVYHNRAFGKELKINVPFPTKKLNIELIGLKEKVAPGQRVSFSVRVTDSHNKPVIASILASAYDASLDAFARNHWSFQTYTTLNYLPSPRLHKINNTTGAWQIYPPEEGYPVIDFTYPRFDWLGFSFNYSNLYLYQPKALYRRGITKHAEEELEAQARPMNAPVVEDKGKQQEQEQEFKEITLRKDLRETAFFFPSITTDTNGIARIEFQMPDALTKWNLQIFASTTKVDYGLVSREIVTVKPLMVYPNIPRFVRQGDQLVLSTKVVNNTSTATQARLMIRIKDAINGTDISSIIVKDEKIKTLHLDANSSQTAAWKIIIPKDQINPVEITVMVKDANNSDAQQQIIPVLTNRVLVTETMPMPAGPKQTRTFTFDRLINSTSSTIKSHRFVLEFNSNPVWYALTSLPYLVEYPYECNEQLFSRFYGNTLASYILNSDPQIKRVFELWQHQQMGALKSPLEQKQDLKQIILEETPWLLDAQQETENKQRLAILFDLNLMASQQQQALSKLLDRQNPDGGWPWFDGGKSSLFITLHIVKGFARLKDKNVFDYTQNKHLTSALEKAIKFTDKELSRTYHELKKNKELLERNYVSPLTVNYLYVRSMYHQIPVSDREAFDYFYSQLKKYWPSLNLYSQATAAITLYNYGDRKLAGKILNSLRERALEDDEMGVYWAENKRGWFWYQAPIETQAMLIEAFDHISHDTAFVEKMKIWILKNKQTNNWRTTIATTEAIYTLIFTGYNWIGENKPMQVTINGHTYPDRNTRTGAGTGYFQKVWTADQITPRMGTIKVTNPNNHPAWGAAYWQYFEDIDKVEAADAGVTVERKYFLVKRDASGEHLVPITAQTPIHVGDEIDVRIILQVSRQMEYLHLKDMRPAGFEPVSQISGYHWQGGMGYYQSMRDASANFFIDYLSKGKYVFEYRVYATIAGDLSAGFATFQCMYAPEFSSHSKGFKVNVK